MACLTVGFRFVLFCIFLSSNYQHDSLFYVPLVCIFLCVWRKRDIQIKGLVEISWRGIKMRRVWVIHIGLLSKWMLSTSWLWQMPRIRVMPLRHLIWACWSHSIYTWNAGDVLIYSIMGSPLSEPWEGLEKFGSQPSASYPAKE